MEYFPHIVRKLVKGVGNKKRKFSGRRSGDRNSGEIILEEFACLPPIILDDTLLYGRWGMVMIGWAITKLVGSLD